MNDQIVIPVYIINLDERTDRLNHILNEFKDKDEFIIEIIQSKRNEKGNVGLWNNIRKCVQLAIERDEDFIILCEDDHVFTDDYNKNILINEIYESYKQGIEILLCGISGVVGSVVPLSNRKFWISHFWGLQFTVIYSSMFLKILDYNFEEKDTADDLLSLMSSNKAVLFPFFSVQKYFGYSDVSLRNNIEKNNVDNLFNIAISKMKIYKEVYEKYIDEK
ncbi:hypothetical protein BAX94_02705 [Elizabethkingia meningoseptica]|uniref:Glycosyl transferase n=1 Tax=Elizabethkingia meningoseptica TaxID=238 RepID=A0A1V3TZ44_ELIME|nr:MULTISPECIES: hypothetical protein [Elizabethkingia]AQX04881.1 hypothetical protein BBD33_06325 [Elizabethkingia meningoseptica]AQX12340.1 hypothetical protein BBD35_08150 [Elizabethkingia meningoseptica]AQX46922.1 hypothetical protein B5G46_06315 [Elizabethkingia meningoseptica]KUY18102.1 hypothetical protein ATB99_07575 [Elizabethkingia meningoseptica]MBG0513871.1 hypothetical protein [Elizabethkingia meningoseptica]